MSTRDSNLWLKSILHNCIIHPIIPLADYLSYGTLSKSKRNRFANLIYRCHDKTAL